MPRGRPRRPFPSTKNALVPLKNKDLTTIFLFSAGRRLVPDSNSSIESRVLTASRQQLHFVAQVFCFVAPKRVR